MDALKIALETIFVGALALPWLILAAQLFFPELSLAKAADFDGWLAKVWSIKSEVAGYTVVGVLAVAMAYTVGAAVSRLAGDFFNDDDLFLHLPTEDQIRASVYCEESEIVLVEIRVPLQETYDPCPKTTRRLWFRGGHANDEPSRSDVIRKIFSLQEISLLLLGEDKTSRLRLFRQQIVILQGVAFDGLIMCLLCVLGWNAKQSWGVWRWLLPIGLFIWTAGAFWNHFHLFQNHQFFQGSLDDPPLLELTWLLLAVGAAYAVWKGTKGSWPQGAGVVSFLLAALAYSGWYWTEILYNQLVIYSFYAGQHPLLKLTP
jgi:hypothetical protein